MSLDISDDPQRVIRLRATATHPSGGPVTGACGLVVGGDNAVSRILYGFGTWGLEIGNPLELTGVRRDAYALMGYMSEKIQRNGSTSDMSEIRRRSGAEVARMWSALEALGAEADPYAGMAGTFEAAYLSNVDGTAQPFTLCIPRGYSKQNVYPLLVFLHGAARTHEPDGEWWSCRADAAYEDTTIGVSVMGRGQWSGYCNLGEDDVLQVIAWVKSHYAIDPDRVYLFGVSMGGMGTWRVAGHHPDLFAACMVDCGNPSWDGLANLVNLPMYVNHGDQDQLVPVAGARLGVDLMQTAGCPVVYSEYPGVDHAVNVLASREGYMMRLAAHRRVTDPAHIHISAVHPEYASMYWGTIVRWDDPHQPAALDAQVLPGNVVSVSFANVAQALLTPPSRHLTANSDIVWMIQGRRITTPQRLDGAYDIRIEGTAVSVKAHSEEPPPKMRAYSPGSFMELYRGEPLLIVYGTRAKDSALAQAIRDMAGQMARRVDPENGRIEFGGIRVIADTSEGKALPGSNNLFLIGGPQENSVTARLMQRLPIREEEGALAVFGGERIPLKGRGYGFAHPNPESPGRLVFVFASSDPAFYKVPVDDEPFGSRVLGEAWRDPAIPDLFVESLDVKNGNQVVRMMSFTYGWQPVSGAEEVLTRLPKSERHFQEMMGEVCRGSTGADFAMVPRGSPDKPSPYDLAAARWQDFAVLLRDGKTLVFEASGKELLDLAKPKGETWWMLSPTPDPATTIADASYRVTCFPDILWGLNEVGFTPRCVRLVDDLATFRTVARRVWGVEKR